MSQREDILIGREIKYKIATLRGNRGRVAYVFERDPDGYPISYIVYKTSFGQNIPVTVKIEDIEKVLP